jgi:glycosyltransferase involved in cell wall biosynthesis
MAAGTPVIAYEAGGALDYVKPNITGEFFEYQTVESLSNSLQRFNAALFSHASIAKQAERFSSSAFQKSIELYLSLAVKKRMMKKES